MNPPYTDQKWLFEEVVIKNRKLQQIADQFGVSRSAVYNWAKKLGILEFSEEYAKDIDTYSKIQKIRKEWLEKEQKENQQITEERKNSIKLIERKRNSKIIGIIESVIETDVDLIKEELEKWDEELDNIYKMERFYNL